MFNVFGNRQGRRVFRWSQFLLAALTIMAASMAFALAVYYLIARRWNPTVLLLGAAAGGFITFVVLVLGWLTPLQRLPMIR